MKKITRRSFLAAAGLTAAALALTACGGSSSSTASSTASSAAASSEAASSSAAAELTTVDAGRRLRSAGKDARRQRAIIDQAAAVAILELALAVERATGRAPGEPA